ncbi:MAG: hypothetical protein JRF33_27000, partial [Deltaproteobacteria bacterium]|nr:hypothetical protein [Deltaproteobacteria bacterium]
MLTFFREGGFSMVLVSLFGLTCLALAVALAIKPSERKLALLRPMSLATIFMVLSGLASNLAAVGKNCAMTPGISDQPDLHKFVLLGIGESMAPAILGFSLLALSWMLST